MKKALLLLSLAACGSPHDATTPRAMPEAKAVPPIRWTIPSCPLRYEVTTREESAMTEPAGSSVVLETFITLDARPAASMVELLATISSQPRTAKFRSFMVPDADFAAVHLATDGKRWIERDGPTFVYSRMGTQGGLEWFFPELPESGAAGASSSWRIDEGDSASVQATEAARGRHKDVAPPDAPTAPISPLIARVTLDRCADRKGAPACEFSMTATRESSGGSPEMRAHTTETFRGSYVVLATGRLLSAEIDRDALMDLTTTFGGKTNVQHHKQHTQRRLHLVSACDGPTEPTLATPLTREERAIDAWGKATVALFKNEREALLDALDPGLRKKWGDAKLWAIFEEVRKVHGERAIAPPVLMPDEDLSSDASEVRIVTRGLVPHPSQAHRNLQHAAKVTLREVDGRFVATSITGEVSTDDHDETFTISRDRLTVRHLKF